MQLLLRFGQSWAEYDKLRKGLLLAEQGVFHVQMRLLRVCDEELGAIGICSTVGHGHHASVTVLTTTNNNSHN